MNPEQFHQRHVKWYGRFDDRVTETPDRCWYCGRNQAVCKSKQVFDTMEEALAAANLINYPGRDRLVIPYGSCPWKDVRHFHLTTASTTSERRRARKRMARQIARQAEAALLTTPQVRPARYLP